MDTRRALVLTWWRYVHMFFIYAEVVAEEPVCVDTVLAEQLHDFAIAPK
jgi:hypothetical protein